LVEVVEVEEEIALGRGELTEVRQVSVPTELSTGTGLWGHRGVGRHNVGGPAEEGELRHRHSPVADGHERRNAPCGLLLEQRDRIRARASRSPGGVARAGNLGSYRLADFSPLWGRQASGRLRRAR